MAAQSPLFASILTMKGIFEEYAGTDGDKKSLSKTEVEDFLRKELGEESSGKKEAEEFFEDFDANGDAVISFQEFVGFVATLALAVYESDS